MEGWARAILRQVVAGAIIAVVLSVVMAACPSHGADGEVELRKGSICEFTRDTPVFEDMDAMQQLYLAVQLMDKQAYGRLLDSGRVRVMKRGQLAVFVTGTEIPQLFQMYTPQGDEKGEGKKVWLVPLNTFRISESKK